MRLKSLMMNLTNKERSWLPWFGSNNKFSLALSCWLNKSTYAGVEESFEGIAATRIKLLEQWTLSHWEHLNSLLSTLQDKGLENGHDVLLQKLSDAPDFSEVFILDPDGQVIDSSYAQFIGRKSTNTNVLHQAKTGRFLHGPYIDRHTLQVGASSSKFHDEVTLMFYLPINNTDGDLVGFLCGRVPNDVIGDLIQREAGHIYQESGDNYLFMVKANFDPSIQAGIALSRSRFEDDTFSHGENLKSGVKTDYGEVRIKNHTEFEIRFTDPATGQLHPGVRETISKGENLFVMYPGYSDYRHIPVIGKGVTFSLPGSPDKWGMMCEGDLEEVYRRRSINLGLLQLHFLSVVSLLTINNSLLMFTDLSNYIVYAITAMLVLMNCFIFSAAGTNRVSKRLKSMTSVIKTIAEGEGNLTQRLDPQKIKQDETGDMSRWINSFIDNLDGIVGQVINASQRVKSTNETMLKRNEEVFKNSDAVYHSMKNISELIQQQRFVISDAAKTTENMKISVAEVVEQANHDFEKSRIGTQAIRDVVSNTASSVQLIDERMSDIGNIIEVITSITSQTNLLALNAAIEAARAGEHGKGFSVVADEVRGLAERTANAASDIQSMIKSLQSETQQAVKTMKIGVKDVDQSLQLTESFSSENSALNAIVDKMFDIIFEIINVIEQNSNRNDQTTQDVIVITESMVQSIQGLNLSTGQVNATANKLQQLVGTFKVTRNEAA
jgi:methyl-accepting chemotaxis protein